jgi:hypothetical protein
MDSQHARLGAACALALVACAASTLASDGSAVVSATPNLRDTPSLVVAAGQQPDRPLGLPRLRAIPAAERGSAKSAVPSFEVDPLVVATPAAGAAVRRLVRERDGMRLLVLEARTDWARPLRTPAGEPGFVSLHVLASSGTQMEVGGARLRVTDSPMLGALHLEAGVVKHGAPAWEPLGIHVAMEVYEGRLLAALPVITVRLDADGATGDVYVGTRLVAVGLPAISTSRTAKSRARSSSAPAIVLRGGEDGLWLCGLVQSTENPLFEDADADGVDDAFATTLTRSQRGRGQASLSRAEVAARWKDEQRLRPPFPLAVKVPRPDPLVSAAPATEKGGRP